MNRLVPLLALAASLAACHAKPGGNALDAVDDRLVNGSATAERDDGLRSIIKVDPARAGGGGASRPVVPRPAANAASPASTIAAGQTNCLRRYGPRLVYAGGWVGRLPAALPLPPRARVIEAAGHDGGCAIRVVSFTVPAGRPAVLDWYAARARAARYGADRETRGGDVYLAGSGEGATYALIAGETRAGATPVDFVWVKPD